MATLGMAENLRAFSMVIDGRPAESVTGRRFESIDPAQGSAWATFPDAGGDDVELAIAAARRAFEGPWSRLTASERGLLLVRLAELVDAHVDAFAELETRENGKLLRETRAQMGALSKWYRYFGGLADKIDGRVPSMDFPTVLSYVVREPVGVVAALVPWNSPLLLSACKLAPALAAGNTVVLKPSEVASASVVEFARLLAEAGFPDGVVNVVTGLGPESGAALVGHPGIDHITFTGGPATARVISRQAAEHLTSTSFELGGKSANIVLEDADVEAATVGALAGIFAAAGQTCIAGSRLLVHRSLYERLLETLVRRAGEIRVGDPFDPDTQMGPLATLAQLERVSSFVEEARDAGATVAVGGRRLDEGSLADGYFFAPTILVDVDPTMRIAQEEVFGPVLVAMPFDDEAQAVEIANGTSYSLAAGIWTADVKRAHRLARLLDAGTVWVNMYRALSPLVPHGGSGSSGHGRENGPEALEEFTKAKAVWLELSDEVRDPFVLRL
jgi:aldehyde dehydrogenase (NAD+)